MKRFYAAVAGSLLAVILAGCAIGKDTEDVLLHRELIVGKDIVADDITDFYYTKSNINYDAYYQRYRFYVDDGKRYFFHETRERKGDYGPCTEEDTTFTGTIELTDDQWSQFYDLVSGGVVKAREESADSGDTGPWLYMYWTNDKSKYQQYSFASYGEEKAFVELCLSLASDGA